ncbi:hypothetical protein AB7714_19785 [Tardiphaga sp. 1201_B9_N1_1]|uniref:hypothetical protein n=1 Tax=unclassified Tardiphaga TaxID=2631404 RepID=UPI003F1EF98E
MPLEQTLRDNILAYCTRDLPGDIEWHIAQFEFIDDSELKKSLGRAYYAARYVAKLMEALRPDVEFSHPFVKFQIIQYASIYEAVVAFLLWTKYQDHPEVKKLQTHKAYKPVSALGSLTKMTFDGEEIHPCLYKDAKTQRNTIPFKEKVDCAVRLGLIDEAYSGDIKKTYALRNLAHLEAEAQQQINVELEEARIGYWRMKPFLERITEALK